MMTYEKRKGTAKGMGMTTFFSKKKKGDLAGVKYEMFCELRNGMKLALWT